MEQGTVPPMLTDPDIEVLVERYRQQLTRFEEAARWVEERARTALRRHAVLAMTSSRAKAPESLKRRLQETRADARWLGAEGEIPFDRVVTDAAGCRALVYRAIDVERASRAVTSALDRAELPRAQQTHAKASGYRAVHLLVTIGAEADRPSLRGTIAEVQIVTLAAHVFNELEHSSVYKQKIEGCARSVAAEVRSLGDAAQRVDEYANDLIVAEARARRAAHERPKNVVELAMAYEVALGRPVHGEFALVFEFAETIGASLVRAATIDSAELIALHDRGRTRSASVRPEPIDDATCILLALVDGQEAEFIKFDDEQRSRNPTLAVVRALAGSNGSRP